ncbi:MAG TPA: ABC transporter ATP-binding protein [Candidatus Baltobacteraceae bacterium]|nr:ABC transporter ATP-binding protein [Candidatus Baltobacteraceae bacterium]
MARVRLDQITKTFGQGKVAALRDVSLEVADGELLTLLGPSGSGKTTLLRVLAGLEAPDRGRVLFGERDVTAVPPEARGIGFVFAKYALYPHLTVAQNIAYGPRAQGIPAREAAARVAELAATMRISALLPRRADQLSGGQQQRVALARAFATNPSVMLLDEPLANLDALLRAELRVELARVLRTNAVTALFVTHDQSEALATSDRIAVLREGEIEQVGTPRSLYDRPANVFVARFVGSPAMSILPGGALDPRFNGLDLGFRADAARLDPAGPLRAVVRAVDDVGADAFVYVDGTFGSLIARTVPASLPLVGDVVGISLDFERAHAFDAESGVRAGPLALV